MFDMPMRLVIAYGLIALIALAGAAFAWWHSHNSQHRRDARARTRLAKRYRQRDEAAVDRAADR
jgi:hypothetical protein